MPVCVTFIWNVGHSSINLKQKIKYNCSVFKIEKSTSSRSRSISTVFPRDKKKIFFFYVISLCARTMCTFYAHGSGFSTLAWRSPVQTFPYFPQIIIIVNVIIWKIFFHAWTLQSSNLQAAYVQCTCMSTFKWYSPITVNVYYWKIVKRERNERGWKMIQCNLFVAFAFFYSVFSSISFQFTYREQAEGKIEWIATNRIIK